MERGTTGSAVGHDGGSPSRAGQVGRGREPAWRPPREPSARLLAWMLSLSALAHLALTPLAGLLGLLSWLLAPPPEPEGAAEQLRSIPISVLTDEELAALEAPEAEAKAIAAPPPEAAVDAPAPAPSPPLPPPRKPEPRPPPKPPAPPRPEASGIGHPVAMSGLRSEVVDANANVNLLLLTDRVRRHPLGPRIGKLLVAFPQWSSFFESGEIDPVRDINRILVVGPQFRRSADVVAILQHDLPPEVMRAAVDRLVQRPPRGRWLKTAFPVARAHADRAERLFALTAPRVLVVAPPHLERPLLAAPPTGFPAPEGEAAVLLHVKTPWRALAGLPFRFPESIAWLRLEAVPSKDGSLQVRVAAEDADERLAVEHARTLSDALNALTNPSLGALGALVGLPSIAFIDEIQLRARDRRITGQVRISPRQLDRLMVYAEELVRSWTGRRGMSAPQGVRAPEASAGRGPTPAAR